MLLVDSVFNYSQLHS